MKQWSRNPGRTPGCPSSSQHRGCHPRVAGERPLSPEAQSRGRVRAEPAGSPLPMQDTALGLADGAFQAGAFQAGMPSLSPSPPSQRTLRTAGPAPSPPPLPEGPAAQPSCPQLQGCGSGSGWSSQPRAQQPLAEAEWVAGERDGAGDVTCSDGATVKARRSCRRAPGDHAGLGSARCGHSLGCGCWDGARTPLDLQSWGSKYCSPILAGTEKPSDCQRPPGPRTGLPRASRKG